MITTPRFSVVVPAHDEADTLAATLASLAAQHTTASYEVIVVDNASTDGTADLAVDAGVRVVPEPRLGVCRARQSGVDAARGEIVVSTDADTTHPVDWLARIDAAFDAASATGRPVTAVAGPCRYVDPPWWAAVVPPLWFGALGVVARATGYVAYVTATNVAFRREEFPGYDVSLHQGGDEVDLLRTLRRTGRVAWDPGLVVDTSARRMREGLPYTVLVSYGYYYLGQRLRRTLTRDATITPAPAVRAGSAAVSRIRRRRWGRACAVVLLAAVLAAVRRHGRRSASPGRRR